MQYVTIKQKEQDNETVYLVNAIPLKNTNKSVVQKIPHPLGTDILVYKTLEEAKEAISHAGFSYILPDGKQETIQVPDGDFTKTQSYEEDLIYETLKNKINSSNSNVCAAAVAAIAIFPKEDTFNLLFEKIGEENDLIRKNAISGICRYGKILTDKIIEACGSQNWIVRNSAITCINQLSDNESVDIGKFIEPLVSLCNDTNPVVQANSITTLALIYQNCKKRK